MAFMSAERLSSPLPGMFVDLLRDKQSGLVYAPLKRRHSCFTLCNAPSTPLRENCPRE